MYTGNHSKQCTKTAENSTHLCGIKVNAELKLYDSLHFNTALGEAAIFFVANLKLLRLLKVGSNGEFELLLAGARDRSYLLSV